MSEACETCRFWKPPTEAEIKHGCPYGDCRRKAPECFDFGPSRRATPADYWCGEYQPCMDDEKPMSNMLGPIPITKELCEDALGRCRVCGIPAIGGLLYETKIDYWCEEHKPGGKL